MRAPDAVPNGRKRVLIVEDDQGIRESLQELLEDEGYAVTTATDGSDGLTKLRNVSDDSGLRPCLVILDLLMPVMNGFEFLAEVKADTNLSVIPIVVVSAGEQGTCARALQAGAVRFVPKPIKLDALLSAVEQFCS